MENDRYYLSEHDEGEVIKRMEKLKPQFEVEERIAKEHAIIQPYLDALRGTRQVPRSEIDPIMDEAIVSGIEGGKLDQGINEEGVVVVFKKEGHTT